MALVWRRNLSHPLSLFSPLLSFPLVLMIGPHSQIFNCLEGDPAHLLFLLTFPGYTILYTELITIVATFSVILSVLWCFLVWVHAHALIYFSQLVLSYLHYSYFNNPLKIPYNLLQFY